MHVIILATFEISNMIRPTCGRGELFEACLSIVVAQRNRYSALPEIRCEATLRNALLTTPLLECMGCALSEFNCTAFATKRKGRTNMLVKTRAICGTVKGS